MHRDKRLGLALGILLLGIVSAFFFRNDGDDASAPPRLADPAKIDGEIAENEFVPYLTGLEGAETSEAVVNPSEAAESPSSRAANRERGPWDFADFLNDDRSDRSLPTATSPPDPIGTQISTQAGIPIPKENEVWEPVADNSLSSKGRAAKPVKPDFADGDVIHRVRKGDTLSSLAEQYLGSSRRFLEIYQANRDRLKDPDDLRVGLPLRIPQAADGDDDAPRPNNALPTVPVSTREEPSAVEPRTTTTPAIGEELNEGGKTGVSADRPIRRFLPVRRHPLTPRPIDTRGSDAGSGRSTSRR